MRTDRFLPFFLCFFLAGAFFGFSALAAGPETQFPEIPGAPAIGEKTLLPEFIVYIYYFAIAVSGFVALAALFYGSMRYLTSQGAPAAKADARGYIRNGIVGIFILLLSWLILNTIDPQLTIFNFAKRGAGLTPEQLKMAEFSMPSATSTYLEIPLGTLIENVLAENKVAQFRDFINQTEERSKKVKQKTEALRAELDKCSCDFVAPDPPCDLAFGCGAGACAGEPCNRPAVERKKSELENASQELRSFMEPWLPIITEYAKDISNLYYGALFLKEGESPIPYEQFLELKQIALEVNLPLEVTAFQAGGETVKAKGNDPMNFYLPEEENEGITERLKNIEFFINISLPILSGSPPAKNPGALAWPFPDGSLTQRFGCQTEIVYSTPCPGGGWLHAGIDIADPATRNHPIYSAGDGVVLEAGVSPGCGYGNWVAIWHEDLGLTTIYANLKTARVSAGEVVSQGQLIGEENTTGFATAEHLHFEVIAGKAWTGGNCFGGFRLDPMDYL